MFKVHLLLPCVLLLINGNHAAGLRRFNRLVPDAAKMANLCARGMPGCNQQAAYSSQRQQNTFSAHQNELLKMEAPKSYVVPENRFKEFEFNPSRFMKDKMILSRSSGFHITGIDAMLENEEFFVKFSMNTLNTHQLQVRKQNGKYQYRYTMNNLPESHNHKDDEMYANHILQVSELTQDAISEEVKAVKKQYNYKRDLLEYVEDNLGGMWMSQWHNMDGLEELLHKQMLYHPDDDKFYLDFTVEVFNAGQ